MCQICRNLGGKKRREMKDGDYITWGLVLRVEARQHQGDRGIAHYAPEILKISKNNIHILVGMGALGASAPTVFESVGASTHGFWQFFSYFHQFSLKLNGNCFKFGNSLAKSDIKHPQFEIPNGGLAVLIFW